MTRARMIAAAIVGAVLWSGAAGDEGWRVELDAVCAKTQDAMALSTDELKSLIARSDALMPGIEKLDESQRKVFSKRLLACKNLYAYVLETRGK